jgi:hypothetical protein
LPIEFATSIELVVNLKTAKALGLTMTLGNMRELGVHHLIAYCLNDACQHSALIDVSNYPAETKVPSSQRHAKCGKCGGKRVDARKRVDVRPNWKEKPVMPTKLRYD